MALLAAAIGAASGIAGTLFSAGAASVPTGPAIVLVATAFTEGSVLFAPQRGVLWRMRQRRALVMEGAREA